MQFRDYVSSNGGAGETAKRLGATVEAVRLWTRGKRIPNREYMLKIVKATKGKVKPNDFYGVS